MGRHTCRRKRCRRNRHQIAVNATQAARQTVAALQMSTAGAKTWKRIQNLVFPYTLTKQPEHIGEILVYMGLSGTIMGYEHMWLSLHVGVFFGQSKWYSTCIESKHLFKLFSIYIKVEFFAPCQSFRFILFITLSRRFIMYLWCIWGVLHQTCLEKPRCTDKNDKIPSIFISRFKSSKKYSHSHWDRFKENK